LKRDESSERPLPVVFDEFGIFQGIAVDQQGVGERAIVNHTKLTGIRIAAAEQIKTAYRG
jgi:hypothetical protein